MTRVNLNAQKGEIILALGLSEALTLSKALAEIAKCIQAQKAPPRPRSNHLIEFSNFGILLSSSLFGFIRDGAVPAEVWQGTSSWTFQLLTSQLGKGKHSDWN
jgi:hypothetical protein